MTGTGDDQQTLVSANTADMGGDSSQKLFIGQIPRDFSEEQLRELMEPFGEITHLHILKDKETRKSKGCAFVTFIDQSSSDEATEALHNVKTLPGMNHALQVKPADTERKVPIEERKLFVGMLNKRLVEEQVFELFQSYGAIEECTVLRDDNKNSKGCAFVTYVNRSSAMEAINALHQSRRMEGCSGPMVVKLADSQQRKLMANMMAPGGGMFPSSVDSAIGIGGNAAPSQQQLLSTQLLAWLQEAAVRGNLGHLGQMTLHEFFIALQALAPTNTPQMGSYILQLLMNIFNKEEENGGGNAAFDAMAAIASMQQAAAAAATLDASYAAIGFNTPSNSYAAMPPMFPTSPHQLAPGAPPHGNHRTPSSQPSPGGSGSVGDVGRGGVGGLPRQNEGPDGCNLFIYHLPQEYTDSDLMDLFSQVQGLISAKVFVDKNTNLSKCFGFVSYSNPSAAQHAIEMFNRYQIGNKKLKVQLKKPREAQPYGGGGGGPAPQILTNTGHLNNNRGAAYATY